MTSTAWLPVTVTAQSEVPAASTHLATFEAVYSALAPVAYRAAYRLVGDRDAAEDIAQEAMVRLVPRWRRVAQHPCPEAWAATVATRLAIGSWRRRRAMGTAVSEGAPDDQRVVDRDALVRALRTLPKRQREVAVLLYLADLPVATVAAVLGCSDGTVKQHASRARQALRAALG